MDKVERDKELLVLCGCSGLHSENSIKTEKKTV